MQNKNPRSIVRLSRGIMYLPKITFNTCKSVYPYT